ncbi:MAG: AMP-binding protein [Candidatus Methanofastidiosia archaeon]|jgi:phenylacetate-coenzyme A ligase PaaK-like adenylate-forming protein
MENWKKLCKMSRKDIRKMQNKKLKYFIRTQVYTMSPYYKEMFKKEGIDPFSIETVEDLQKLPFTYKENVAPTDEEPKKYKDFIIRPDEEVSEKYGHMAKLSLYGGQRVVDEKMYDYKPVHMHFTTGRTANPTPFVYSQRDVEYLKEGGKRLLDVFGISDDDVCLNAFPYAPHLAFWQTYFAAEASGITGFHSGGGKVIGTQNLIDAIEEMRFTVLIFIPGYCYYLLRKAAEQNRDFSSVQKVIFGGERVPPGLKTKIKDLLGEMGASDPMVLATYACTESRVAWGECPAEESFGYHIYPDMEIIETVDPKTGEPVGEGEDGEIVYTSLDWRGTCVLRYRTGDVAKGGITYEKCPNCGRMVPRISANIQRKSEFKEFNLKKVKGTLVNLNAFFPLMMGHPDILEWQVELRKRNDDPYDLDEIYLYVTPQPGVDPAGLKAALKEKILREMEVSPNDIFIVELKKLLHRLGMETELKEKRILDNRPVI